MSRKTKLAPTTITSMSSFKSGSWELNVLCKLIYKHYDLRENIIDAVMKRTPVSHLRASKDRIFHGILFNDQRAITNFDAFPCNFLGTLSTEILSRGVRDDEVYSNSFDKRKVVEIGLSKGSKWTKYDLSVIESFVDEHEYLVGEMDYHMKDSGASSKWKDYRREQIRDVAKWRRILQEEEVKTSS